MTKVKKPQDNHADQLNPNPGTPGISKARKAVLDNRSKQLNPNNPLYKGPKRNKVKHV